MKRLFLICVLMVIVSVAFAQWKNVQATRKTIYDYDGVNVASSPVSVEADSSSSLLLKDSFVTGGLTLSTINTVVSSPYIAYKNADNNFSTTQTVTGLHVSGETKADGIITAPTGLTFTNQSSNPGGSASKQTLWGKSSGGSNDWLMYGQTRASATAGNTVTVAKDGTGDYATIQAAITASTGTSSSPVIILVYAGLYNEQVIFENKHYITLKGISRDACIIRWDVQNQGSVGSVIIKSYSNPSTYISLENLTIENLIAYQPTGGASPVIMAHAGGQILRVNNCNMIGTDNDIISCSKSGTYVFTNCRFEQQNTQPDMFWVGGETYILNCEMYKTHSQMIFSRGEAGYPCNIYFYNNYINMDAITNETTDGYTTMYASGNWSPTKMIYAMGTIFQVESRLPKRTLILSAAGGLPTTTAGCGQSHIEMTTNKENLLTLDFDGAGTAKEYAQWVVYMPENWDHGTVTATFNWTANSTTTNTVKWEISAVALNEANALDTAFGTAVAVTDTNQSTAYKMSVSSETAAITIGNVSSSFIGQPVIFQVNRDPANDTLTDDALLISVAIKYSTSKFSD